MSKIASVHISTGVFWAEIVIESTGGTDPITSHGHRKADAQRILTSQAQRIRDPSDPRAGRSCSQAFLASMRKRFALLRYQCRAATAFVSISPQSPSVDFAFSS
jgi:hypothetical protein